MKRGIAVLDRSTEPCCPVVVARDMEEGDAERAASVFKALGDPGRVRIVNRLANAGQSLCVCDLQGYLSLSQATVSFHLKKLLEAGLLDREQRGTWAFYSLRPDVLDQLGRVFSREGGSR